MSPASAGNATVIDDDLVPPQELLFDGTNTQAEFISAGEGFVRHFLIDHCHLQPEHRVLDLGCGNGQKARVLARYLDAAGSYEGLDIVPAGIEWCRQAYRNLPRFRFQLADVHNKHYHPTGTYQAKDYPLPYREAEFDLVFLCSVFTHMLPADLEHYLSEISRVLKSGGRCAISYFLLNLESLRAMGSGRNVINPAYLFQEGVCRVASLECPETTVAYDEPYVRALYMRHGLSVCEISYGFWSGRKDLVQSLQDVVIALKAEGLPEEPVQRPGAGGDALGDHPAQGPLRAGWPIASCS